MKQVVNGFGEDTTTAVLALLSANAPLYLATIYLIGEPEDPLAYWFTDYESPLKWSLWGTFQNVVIKRSPVKSKIGLDVTDLTVTWAPAATTAVKMANPYQRVSAGWFDNKVLRSWTVYMSTPGDADTLGCSELFGGRIKSATINRGNIQFKVNSFLDVINQQYPLNTIELTNTMAAYRAATPPPGMSRIPQFNVIDGSTPGVLIADCTSPTAHHIFADNKLLNGYVIFNQGGSETLPGIWSAIAKNELVTIAGDDFNKITLFTPTPWSPTPGDDTFAVSGSAPINFDDGEYLGFPYVQNPESAI
jgi:hypothetical protein